RPGGRRGLRAGAARTGSPAGGVRRDRGRRHIRNGEVRDMAKGRILVVDDEIYIVHILDFSLGMEGYEVVTALDGEQALEKARAEKPDLIVLDIMMPKLDGYETSKRLKADPAHKDVPAIRLPAKG